MDLFDKLEYKILELQERISELEFTGDTDGLEELENDLLEAEEQYELLDTMYDLRQDFDKDMMDTVIREYLMNIE